VALSQNCKNTEEKDVRVERKGLSEKCLKIEENKTSN